MSQKNCGNCKSKLVLRQGPYGEFWGCSQYPNCRYTEKNVDVKAAVWVSASDIRQINFCPQSFIHRLHARKVEKSAKRRMHKGQRAHAKISKGDRRCFIASYAFHEEHPIVNDLRHWRDNFLLQHALGRLVVECYYFLSPKIIARFQNNKAFLKISRLLIKKVHSKIIRR